MTSRKVRTLARQALLRWHGVSLKQFSTAEILAVPLRDIQQFLGYKVTDEMLRRTDYTAGQLIRWADAAVHYSSNRCMKRAAHDLKQLTVEETMLLLLNSPWSGHERKARSCVCHLKHLLKECTRRQVRNLIKTMCKRDRRAIVVEEDACVAVLKRWFDYKPRFDYVLQVLPDLDFISRPQSRVASTVKSLIAEFVNEHIVPADIATGVNYIQLLDASLPNPDRPVTGTIRACLVEKVARLCSAIESMEERLQIVYGINDDRVSEVTLGAADDEERVAALKGIANIK